MRPLVIGLAAALVTTTAFASAEPALPKGWVAGSGQLDDAGPPKRRGFGSFQANHEFTFRVRAPFPGGRYDLGALPVVEIEPSPIPEAPPRELPEGTAGDVVVLKKRGAARVTVRGFEAGFMQVGKSIPLGVGRQSEGGASQVCGHDSLHGVVPLAYEMLRRVDAEGSIELTWARGFLDAATCRVAILERHSARPQHVAGGILFAFRTRCAACAEGARDVLHVLTPQMGSALDKAVPFEHRTFAFGPGRSAAFEGTSFLKMASNIGTWGMPDWENLINRRCKQSSTWCTKSVRLEVSQGRGETAPTLFIGGDDL